MAVVDGIPCCGRLCRLTGRGWGGFCWAGTTGNCPCDALILFVTVSLWSELSDSWYKLSSVTKWELTIVWWWSSSSSWLDAARLLDECWGGMGVWCGLMRHFYYKPPVMSARLDDRLMGLLWLGRAPGWDVLFRCGDEAAFLHCWTYSFGCIIQ